MSAGASIACLVVSMILIGLAFWAWVLHRSIRFDGDWQGEERRQSMRDRWLENIAQSHVTQILGKRWYVAEGRIARAVPSDGHYVITDDAAPTDAEKAESLLRSPYFIPRRES